MGRYRFGAFELDPSERQLYEHGRAIRLQPKVFDALLSLVDNAGRLVRRDELVDTLWPETFVTDANLTNVIVTLRKILSREAIQTVSEVRLSILDAGAWRTRDRSPPTRHSSREGACRNQVARCHAGRRASCSPSALPPIPALRRRGRGSDARRDFSTSSNTTRRRTSISRKRRFAALAIDPHLACAHHFYTQLQVDLGESRDAMVRLARRIIDRGDEPESHAGLEARVRALAQLKSCELPKRSAGPLSIRRS